MGAGMVAHQHSFWLLIALCMKGILAGMWSVHVPSSPICAVTGSSVVLPCSYDYPQSSNVGQSEKSKYKVLSEMWCLGDSQCITQRYVFHSAGVFPDPSYQNRVQYLGQPGTKNCSLRISNLKQSDSGTYVFYLITSHPTEKMPAQSGIQLLVADSSNEVAVSAGPSRVVIEGAALRLSCCSPAASSHADFRWYKSTNTSPLHGGQVWKINEITLDNSGSYFCQIQTGEKQQTSTMLAIDVQYPPQNTSVSVLPAGELQDELHVTLTCSSDANPPVHTYFWYQGAACVPTADKSFYLGRQTQAAPTGRGPTLSSANITTEEHGQHCCVARNRHGSQTYSITLRGSRAVSPSDSSGGRLLYVGVTVGILLAIFAIVAFLIARGKKKTRHRSYVLTETTATEP
ncbi:LOW QUALITY PROTEIN: cell adhesion molecule CEACAM6 [Leuresthes tenuis]|uniref:LOW QUALITY PROTEIN: cell adhesion molecule CEACAM6 n=1 Tax=Leuresthes tenuis TaxID=355514 RepID=UPI003B505724